MVWTSPRAVLLAKLGVNEAGFRKICQGNRIPAPPGQAWVKPGTSNQHFRARLPKREFGENPFVFFSGDFTREEQGAWLDEMLSEPLEGVEEMTARFRKSLAKINDHDNPFRLHDAIADLIHPLPIAANDEVAMETRRDEQRRLNLLNEIFLYAEALGGPCRFGGLGGKPHAIRIGHMNVQFTLGSVGTADRLRLEVVSPSRVAEVTLHWEDTVSLTLENRLPEIMVGMGVIAEMMCRRERASWNSEAPVLAGDRSSLTQAAHG